MQARTSVLALGAALGVSQVRSYAEAWRNVERRLASIGENSDEQQQALISLALRTRTEVGATAGAVQKLSRSTGDDLETTIRRVETLQKLLAFGGASGAERSSVSLQLGQALQSGVLSGDEFRTIREAAPVEFLDALASAAGIARSELKEFAEDQKLTRDIVLEALDSMAAQADGSFRKIAVSGDEAVATLTTGLTAYLGRVDEGLGTTATFNSLLVNFGEYLAQDAEGAENLARSIQIVSAAALAGAGGRGIGATTRALREASAARLADVAATERQSAKARQAVIDAKTQISVLQERRRVAEVEFQQRVFQEKSTKRASRARAAAIEAEARATTRLVGLEARATAATNAMTAAKARLSIATRISTAAIRGFNSVLAFFGGPVGLALTAITTTLAVMATRTSEVERLTANVTDRVNSLKTAYAETGGQVDRLREKMASASLAEAITEAEELTKLFDQARETASDSISQPLFSNLVGKNPELGALIEGLVSGQIRADEFRERLNELVASAGIGFARMLEIFKPILEPLLQAAENSEKASDVLLVLQGSSDQAAEAMVRLGLASREASGDVNGLAESAAAAASGIAGLVSQIPELQRAAQVQAKLAKATKDRDAALKGLNDQGLSGTERLEEERRILGLYERATDEIDGSAEATRKATKALDDYLDQSKITALDARGQALEREAQRYENLVEALEAAKAGEDDLAAAEKAHAENRAAINSRFDKRSKGAGGVSKATKQDLRNLAQLQEVLIEGGYRQLYIDQAVNAERKRLTDLMPTLISLGLSKSEADALMVDQLKRVKEELGDVRTSAEEATRAFARGVLDDIRAADDLNDAIGRISDRLLDLAFDQAFDLLAEQFARLAFPSGGGSPIVDFVTGLIGGARARGGPTRRGTAYLVNEETPNSEVFVPSQNGAVLNVQQAQAALRSTSQTAAKVAVRTGDLVVDIHNYSTATVSAERNATGRLDITIRDHMKSAISSGSLDGALQQRFGIGAKPRGA
ncbi:tape measure protein [Phaeobacter gallaeciensis]|uniref:tape measure protein n=1 Tax=Phaeobacter gallaeciensis TaxID=60890 RepID=UPI001314FD82|nr:tape measure protein [Phaeobacter gallaeciensis]